ncbi:5'-3' exoribonuclease [bacterium HR33]|nr:5'-3' exoribonuclease [bacterium HR33]
MDRHGAIDLHLHSNASDGEQPPGEVVRSAAAKGLGTIALTDHDTLAGVEAAREAGAAAGVRVISGCEFSVSANWGEMHLLGYFLPPDSVELARFLEDQRAKRTNRAAAMVRKLVAMGVKVRMEDVLAAADGGAVGRPHVARALVAVGAVSGISEAFERYLAFGRPAFVPKELPDIPTVTALIKQVGGVSVAAHLKDRGSTAAVQELKDLGVDGIEVLHPSHDESVRNRLLRATLAAGLLPTGGSDWHGDSRVDGERGALGSVDIPPEWLERLEGLHRSRATAKEVQR